MAPAFEHRPIRPRGSVFSSVYREEQPEVPRSRPGREVTWRDIHGLRYQPPGRASRGDRRRVFCASLEQSGQLFTAAAAVDYASRPILLFYGLSQAGRAVAAGSTAADNDSYRLSGHGIEAVNLSQRPPLHRIELTDKGVGSFTRLASLLGCGSLPQGALFGQIWAVTPDLRDSPLDTGGVEYQPALRCEEQHLKAAIGKRTGSIRLPWRLGEAPDAAAIETYLAAYPALSGCQIQVYAGAIVDIPGGPHGLDPEFGLDAAGVRATWENNRALMAFQIQAGSPPPARPYIEDDDLWLFPAMKGAAMPLHPLLSWWALLFALSMLARYESASWIRHLDIDASPDAIKLRTALDLALGTCPQLIMAAVRSASS